MGNNNIAGKTTENRTTETTAFTLAGFGTAVQGLFFTRNYVTMTLRLVDMVAVNTSDNRRSCCDSVSRWPPGSSIQKGCQSDTDTASAT